MMSEKLTPIQLLRQEKRQLKRQIVADEERIVDNWEYLTQNVGSLLFHSTIKGAKGVMGLSSKPQKSINSGASPLGSSVLINSLTAVAPLAWEMLQPVLMGYMMNKVKSFFSFKKKKKKYDDD